MTHAVLNDHKKWRDELVYHLRMKDVSGDRIGDILLEAESHIRQTGETPEQAFGDAKEYAEAHLALNPGVSDGGPSMAKLIGIAFGSFVGAGLYASGIIGLGRGEDAVFGFNPWLPFLVGVAILLIGVVRLPADLVRHPDTNAPLLGGMTTFRVVTLAVLAVAGILLFFLGRALA